MVTPFVGRLSGYTGTHSRDEVDHVFTVPLSYLRSHPPDVYETFYEPRFPADFPYDRIHGGKAYPFGFRGHDICFYEIPQHERRIMGTPDKDHPLPVLWGFTARLTRFFLNDEKKE